jgi:hypothetical protein
VSDTRKVTLPSNGQEIELPELSTEQVLQLIRLAKNVLHRLPDLLEIFEEARLEYLKGEARGFVSKPYYEGLGDEERTALDSRLDTDFQEWFFFDDLSSEEQEALGGIGISPESLKEEPIQFSFPSEVPTLALMSKVFPEIYDACADEIIMAVAVTLMPAGRLEKAVRTNTVDAQLMDFRADLTQKLKPADFIHLAAQVVSYVLGELKALGGDLGKVLTDIQSQLGEIAGAKSQSEQSSETKETSSETSEAESSSDFVDLPTD